MGPASGTTFTRLPGQLNWKENACLVHTIAYVHAGDPIQLLKVQILFHFAASLLVHTHACMPSFPITVL